MLLTVIAATLMSQQPSKVQIVSKGAKFELKVNGRSFFVKGAGAPRERYAELAKFGANSVRTWGVNEETIKDLDEAAKRGIMLTVGFWMRKGDGFSYKNPQMLAEQRAEFRKWVRTYKNHPALLMWAVGNEVELGGESPEIWTQTEALAKIAKEEDPNHPVIGVYADMWPEKMSALLSTCKSLDALGINSYDGLPTLDQRMKPWTKPYFITEYQFSIPTKSEDKPWAGFIEPTSQQKADSTAENYKKQILAFPGRVLGSYFFYWRESTVGTASLHPTHINTGEWLASARTMATVWRGSVPKNRAPIIKFPAGMPAEKVKAGSRFTPQLVLSEPDGDPMDVQYEILPNDPSKRFVGDFEQNLGVVAKGKYKTGDTLTMPKEKGLYRILFVARDGKGAAATGSISLLVE